MFVTKLPHSASFNDPCPQFEIVPAGRLHTLALTCNLRTIVQGCGYKGYPWHWWWSPFENSLKRCRLLTHVSFTWPNMVHPREAMGRVGQGTTLSFVYA